MHRFEAIAWGGLRITRWTCRNCGLKVNHRAAAQLEGKPCF